MADVYIPADSQRRLIEIARQTLEAITHRREFNARLGFDPYLDEVNYGAFVTLFNERVLRGCVGTCTPSSALREVVIEMTEAAACHDRRVKPVRIEELEQIHIDVAVISRLERTDHPLDLEIGKHGVHVAHRGRQAVFLPQVAVEHGWSPATLLEQTCLKANLPNDAWRSAGATISLFTALLIEEAR